MIAGEAVTSLILGNQIKKAEAVARTELDQPGPAAGAEAEARHVEGRAGLIALQGRIMRTAGNSVAAIALLREAIDSLPDRPTLARTLILCELAHAHTLIGQSEDAFEVATRARSEAEVVGDAAVRGRALHVLGLELIKRGRDEEGLAALWEALALSTESDDLDWVSRGYINLSDSLRLLGRYEESMAVARDGYQVACDHGMRRTMFVMMNVAEVLLTTGRLVEAETITGEHLSDQSHMAQAHHGLTAARTQLRRGHPTGVAAELERLGELVAADENVQFTMSVLVGRLELAWLTGHDADVVLAEAAEVLARPTDSYDRQDCPGVAALAARLHADRVLDPRSPAAVVARSRAALDELAEQAEVLRTQPLSSMDPGLAADAVQAERARSRGDSEDARSSSAAAWAQVEAAASAMPDAWYEAYAAWRLAEVAAVVGDKAGAASAAGRARRVAADHGADGLVREIDGLVRRARLDLPPPAAVGAGVASVSSAGSSWPGSPA
ncbi:MAG: transcriptional regulator, LuxR family, partial [Acidimicrobiales bacterium]|nr:transcriptional regulator, LuxR family [Acidimicrobiales bacterium]